MKYANQQFIKAPATENQVVSISAFDPFQRNLQELQLQDKALQIVQKHSKNGKWPKHIKPSEIKYAQAMKENLFQDKNKLI
jgi:hypothetical protein